VAKYEALTGMTEDQLLDWAISPNCPDRKIKEFGCAALYHLTDSEVDYMIVDTDSLPGLKLGGVWHVDSHSHPLFRCSECGRGPIV
jgi:hypothetical protein